MEKLRGKHKNHRSSSHDDHDDELLYRQDKKTYYNFCTGPIASIHDDPYVASIHEIRSNFLIKLKKRNRKES